MARIFSPFFSFLDCSIFVFVRTYVPFSAVLWYNQYMEQTLTAKLKILPTPSETELLMDTMRTYSEACNYVSDYVFRTHELDLRSLNSELYYAIRQKYSLPSQMAQSVLRTVAGRYKTILTSEKRWIRPKFRTPQLDLVWKLLLLFRP